MRRLGPTLLIAFALPAGAQTGFDTPAVPLASVVPRALGSAVFYSLNLTVLGILLAIAVSLRHRAWTLYTLLVALGLTYIGIFEQNLTGIVWTGIDLSAGAVLAAGFAMLSINFLIAADTIPLGHPRARLKSPLRLAALGIWGLWAAGTAVSLDLGYTLFSACGCLVAVAHFFPVSTFVSLRGGYDQIIRNLIWILLTLVLIGATVIITDAFGYRSLTVSINRALIATITLVFTILFLRNIFVLKSDRELAVQEALDRANTQIRIGQELLEANQRHAAALDLARLQNMRLATASHDIRQPISSLRTMVATLVRNQPEAIRRHLQTSLDYLDELAASYLEEGRLGAEAPEGDSQAAAMAERTDQGETVAAALIGETLRRMFSDDAKGRGLTLEVAVEPAQLTTQTLPLMRVLSNLVSNAITHAAEGPVRLTGGRTAQGYAFSVANAGAATLDFDAFAKGESSPGSGLGLAIVRQQAARAGLDVSVDDEAGAETRITILIADPVEAR